MNTTPVAPHPTTVVRFVVVLPPPVNKAAKTVVENEAVAEVRRAVNAYTYGEV